MLRPGAASMSVMALAALLSLSGCQEPDDAGIPFDEVRLPTDLTLDLNCPDVGVYTETCILDDPDNPFITTAIVEFDINNADAFNKFDLANAIPLGPSGAKTRFYFWATALARRASGENQYYTALALHELYSAQQDSGAGDPIVRDQALAAYRSVLDNFFGGVTNFVCDFRDGVFRGCPAPDFDPALDDRATVSLPLNELVADNLFRTDATGFARLVPGDTIFALDLLREWGYSYQPATPPDFNDGVVSVNEG